ncbi:uncharacterized protein LOC143368066 [Andrena cerasifolii]|uniref:uncharacterized protein LOC143368066 n=1 Tax=Andrena cerasifolii TaxID=2819439 RepID=UPI0040382162
MYSVEKRSFLVQNYLRTRSYLECQGAFREKYPGSPVPNKTTISRLARKFREYGSLTNRKHHRKSTVLTIEKLAEVRQILEEAPHTSLAKLQQRCGFSYGSVRLATQKLHMRPYRCHTVQLLKEPDYAGRRRYCEWFLDLLEEEEFSVSDRLFFTDEAWFRLDDHVTNQNSRNWSTANSREIREKPLHSAKVGVWCAISRKRIVGPHFFDTTITAGRGTGAHSTSTTEMLEEFFGHRAISRDLWPPRSPDLTPPDFFCGVR